MSGEQASTEPTGAASRPAADRTLVGGGGPEPIAGIYGELVSHWFNGVWGRLARRDVYIRTDGTGFELELRAGGAGGRPWRRPFPTLAAAVDEGPRAMAPAQKGGVLTPCPRRGAAI